MPAADLRGHVRSYHDFGNRQRAAYAASRRDNRVRALRDKAGALQRQARRAQRSARVAKFLRLNPGLEATLRATIDELNRQAAAAIDQADALASGALPATVDDPADWHRLNSDEGRLTAGPITTGVVSALTGSDRPPSIDRTRRYDERGGLRRPLAQHQVDLETAVPRDSQGRPVRGADPRTPYFGLLNDGGPTADPTRAINCQDCVLSFFETYLHGRPRVSAPRTFDAYAKTTAHDGEQNGPERIEHATGGRLQALCPDVAGSDPTLAQARVAQAFDEVRAQLTAGGPGSFAFLLNSWEGGAAHAWAAVNQGGEILFVDPQSGLVAAPGTTLYAHLGRPDAGNVTALDALVVDGRGNPMTFANRPDGTWRPQRETLPPAYETQLNDPFLGPLLLPATDNSPQPDSRPLPPINDSPSSETDPLAVLSPPEPAVTSDPAFPADPSIPADGSSTTESIFAADLAHSVEPALRFIPTADVERDAAAERAYFGYAEHARRTHEANRREEHGDFLAGSADAHRTKAAGLADQAAAAQREGATVRAHDYLRSSREFSEAAADLDFHATQVRSGTIAPERVEVDDPHWSRINHDVGNLAPGGLETDDRSALTGDDTPPPVDRTRHYGTRGGLRPPLAVHQQDLERAVPRDADGRPQRLPDPREGTWFALANDGGPTQDPTRGINCLDGVLSLFDTYLHGRPRVSAPRTFDSYRDGEPARPLGAEEAGLTRIQEAAGAEFQGLCPYVGELEPTQAQAAVDTAMTNLRNHLYNTGHGAFAFIVTEAPEGSAHAWAAINHNGTILFLDPQTARISEETPLYNPASMDALVVAADGTPAPLPYHQPGPWSGAPPTGAPSDPDPEPSPQAGDAEREHFDPVARSEETAAQLSERAAFESLPEVERAVLSAAYLEAESVADRVLRDIQGVTADLARAGVASPEIVGQDHRVKTVTSLARAFKDESQFEQIDLADFVRNQKDRVRFSIQLDEAGYGASVKAALAGLAGRGYEVQKIVNFWGSGGRHNGLNVSVLDPSGFLLEIQFPTALSWAIGKQTHSLYEILRIPRFSFGDRIEAFLQMVALNKINNMDAHQPQGLEAIGPVKQADSSLANWIRHNTLDWDSYVRELAARQTSFDSVLERHGLTPEDVFRSADPDASRDDPRIRLSGGPEVRHVGPGHQPDRPPGDGAGAAAGRDLERPTEGLDLRLGAGGSLPLRRAVLRSDQASGPPNSGADSPRSPADGTTDRRDPPNDDGRGHPDGLGERPAGAVAPAGDSLEVAQRAVLDRLGPRTPVLADIVARLLADHVHNGHRLNATEALLDPARRERALALLEELGRASALASYPSLTAFLADHHGIGGLFDPVTPEINTDSFGRSRKQVFEIEARRRDPVRAVGPTPDSAELTLLDEYGVRLRLRVLPAALREITELSAALGDGVRVSARAKRAADLLDKVRRMTTDRPRRPGRPDYRIGDVIDAVGVRLTVPDMPTLELALDRIRSHFGVGDGGRILEIENMYAEPKSQAPAYRVIPIIVAIETDGHPCTYELQLTTERASLAADVEHNTIYKPYVATDAAQRIVVERIMEEAAALDQLEIVDRNDHE